MNKFKVTVKPDYNAFNESVVNNPVFTMYVKTDLSSFKLKRLLEQSTDMTDVRTVTVEEPSKRALRKHKFISLGDAVNLVNTTKFNLTISKTVTEYKVIHHINTKHIRAWNGDGEFACYHFFQYKEDPERSAHSNKLHKEADMAVLSVALYEILGITTYVGKNNTLFFIDWDYKLKNISKGVDILKSFEKEVRETIENY